MTTMPTPKRRRCIDFTDSSTVRLSEVIGDATRPVAQLLALLDVTAGRCGFRHARSGVVTGCFDVIDVLAPVRSGDIVTSVGSILAVGSRSMLIQVDAYVEPRVVTTPLAAPTHIISAVATFVAKSNSAALTKPDANIGNEGLLATYKAARKRLSTASAQASSPPTTSLSVRFTDATSAGRAVSLRDTHVTTARYFLPRALNFSGALFGGEILASFEAAATAAAARVFCTPCRMHGARAFAFWHAVPQRAVLCVDAVVIGVCRRVAAVFVRACLEDVANRKPGDDNCSHTAVIFATPAGKKGQDLGEDTDVAIVVPTIEKNGDVARASSVEQAQCNDTYFNRLPDEYGRTRWTDEEYVDYYHRAVSVCSPEDFVFPAEATS